MNHLKIELASFCHKGEMGDVGGIPDTKPSILNCWVYRTCLRQERN